MSYQLKRLGLSANAEVLIKTNTTTKFFFSDTNLLLDNVLIHGLYAPRGIIKTPLSNDIAPVAIGYAALIRLNGKKNQQFNTLIPLNVNGYGDFLAGLGGQMPEIIYFKPKLISVRNCTIEVPNIAGTVIPANGYSIMLTFFYEKYNPAIHRLNDWDELITDEDDSPLEQL